MRKIVRKLVKKVGECYQALATKQVICLIYIVVLIISKIIITIF